MMPHDEFGYLLDKLGKSLRSLAISNNTINWTHLGQIAVSPVHLSVRRIVH